MEMSILSKNLNDFFCHKRGSEIMFADREEFRCRLGLCIRTVWISGNGFVPARPIRKEFVFSVSKSRVNDFGLMYIVSQTREIGPEIPGRIVTVDAIENDGVFYYTIIFEKKEIPRLLERKNWE